MFKSVSMKGMIIAFVFNVVVIGGDCKKTTGGGADEDGGEEKTTEGNFKKKFGN
jgi:hypothetical protein